MPNCAMTQICVNLSLSHLEEYKWAGRCFLILLVLPSLAEALALVQLNYLYLFNFTEVNLKMEDNLNIFCKLTTPSHLLQMEGDLIYF